MSSDLQRIVNNNLKILDGRIVDLKGGNNYTVYSSSLKRTLPARGSFNHSLGDRVLLGRDQNNYYILTASETRTLSSSVDSSILTYVPDYTPPSYSESEEPSFIYPIIYKGGQKPWPVRYYFFEGSSREVGLVASLGAVSFVAGFSGTTNAGIVNPTQGVTYNCWIEGFLDVKTNMNFPEKWKNSSYWPVGQEPKSRELKVQVQSTLATSSIGGFGLNIGLLPFQRSFDIFDLTIKRQGIALLGEQIIKSLASNVFDFMSTSEIVTTMTELPPFVLPSFDKTEYGLGTPRITEDLFRNNMIDSRDPDDPIDYSDISEDPDTGEEIIPDPFNSTVELEKSDSFDTDYIRYIGINSTQLDRAVSFSSLNGSYPIHFGTIYPLWNKREQAYEPTSRFQAGVFENGGIQFGVGNTGWEYIRFIRDQVALEGDILDNQGDTNNPPPQPPDPDDYLTPQIRSHAIRCVPFYPTFTEEAENFLYKSKTIDNGKEFFKQLLPDYEIDFSDTHSGRRIVSNFFRTPQIRVETKYLTVNGYGARQSEIFPFLIFNNNGIVDFDYEGVSFTSPKLSYNTDDQPPPDEGSTDGELGEVREPGSEGAVPDTPTINIVALSTSTPWIKKATVEVLIQDNVETPKYPDGDTDDIIYDEDFLVRGLWSEEPITLGSFQTTRWVEQSPIDELDILNEDIKGIDALEEDQGVVRCRFKTKIEQLPEGQKWLKLCTIYRPPVNFAFEDGSSIKDLIKNPDYIGLGDPTNSPYIYVYEYDGMPKVLQVRFTIDEVFRESVCVETFSGLVCTVRDVKNYTSSNMFPTLRIFSQIQGSSLKSHYDLLGYRFDVTSDPKTLPLNPDNPGPPDETADLNTGFRVGNGESIKKYANYGTRNVVRLPDPNSPDPELRISPIRENIYLDANLQRKPFTYNYEFRVVEGSREDKKYRPHVYYPPININVPDINDILETPYPIEIDANEDAIKDATWEFYNRLNYMLFVPFNFELYKLLGSDRSLVRNKTNTPAFANQWFDNNDPSTGVII